MLCSRSHVTGIIYNVRGIKTLLRRKELSTKLTEVRKKFGLEINYFTDYIHTLICQNKYCTPLAHTSVASKASFPPPHTEGTSCLR